MPSPNVVGAVLSRSTQIARQNPRRSPLLQIFSDPIDHTSGLMRWQIEYHVQPRDLHFQLFPDSESTSSA